MDKVDYREDVVNFSKSDLILLKLEGLIKVKKHARKGNKKQEDRLISP